jgi:hypothetical protein
VTAQVIDYLGMQPCDGTAAVPGKPGATTHNLHLSGVFVGSRQVLVRAQLQLDPQAGMVLKVRQGLERGGGRKGGAVMLSTGGIIDRP